MEELCLTYIHVDKRSLIAPFFATAVWIDPKYPTIDLLRLKSKKDWSALKNLGLLETIPVEAEDIDRWGLHVAAVKAVKIADFNLKHKLREKTIFSVACCNLPLDLGTAQPLFIDNMPYCGHLKVARLYSQRMRLETIDKISKQFPKLEIKSHLGRPTPEHLAILKNLKLLPPFYIKSKVREFI